MHSSDWAQGEYKYELFSPFLHHYKSCFHSVLRQMGLDSKGQKQAPVNGNCAVLRGMDVSGLQHRDKPSPQELGNHPLQPLWKEAEQSSPGSHMLGIPHFSQA